MKLFKIKKKERSNWSVRFAWLPVKVEHNYKYYPWLDDQSEATSRDDCSIYTINRTEYWWVWLEYYRRFFNYGAHCKYYLTKKESRYLREENK